MGEGRAELQHDTIVTVDAGHEDDAGRTESAPADVPVPASYEPVSAASHRVLTLPQPAGPRWCGVPASGAYLPLVGHRSSTHPGEPIPLGRHPTSGTGLARRCRHARPTTA